MKYTLPGGHPHPEDLDDGTVIGPGEQVELTEERAGHPHNKRLIDEEILFPTEQGEEPAILEGKDLRDRGKKLNIKNYSTMEADDLRQAVVEVEQLQGRAEELKVEGVSKMSDEELRQAVETAEQQKEGGSS